MATPRAGRRRQRVEVGPLGRGDFAGRWIGPSENLLAQPLPPPGPWIAPPDDFDPAGGAGSLAVRFTLPAGHPRCFGMAWVACDAACRVELNGKPLDTAEPLGLHQMTPVRLPWDQLRKGENVLAVIGPVEALGRGVKALARIHEAGSGYHHLATGDAWRFTADGRDGPARVLSGTKAPPDLPAPADNGPRHAIELRRAFNLDQPPQEARVYVTGLGCYELWINGRRVGDDLLAPGWTDFNTRLHYAAHDVTALLRSGENTVTAVLGNGWWSAGMGWESLGKTARPDQPLRLLLDLIDLGPGDKDAGANTLLTTDDAWQWRPSTTVRDTLYHGQSVDLSEEPGPWRPVAVLNDDFNPTLEPALQEPIRVTQELKPQNIKRLDTGDGDAAWLFDFGQNHAGRPRLRLPALPGPATLRLTHCEVLDGDGQPYFENYRTAAARDEIALGKDAAPLDWSPQFTYRGYRYAVLRGLPVSVTPEADTLVSQVLHNDVREASTFSCSNPLLNQIDRFVRWGLRSNLHSVPTDCPQRDERLGWTGDVNLFAPTSCWLYDLRAFYRKWLIDIFDAQAEDGQVMPTAPYSSAILPGEGAPVWADIITVLPTVLHRFYDDRSILAAAYGPMKRWVDWYASRAVDGLALVGGFGDWVALEPTPPEMVGAAYFAYSSRLVADAARVLGHDDDAERYAAQADWAGEAFHRHYFDDAAGAYRPDTQTAQTLGLAFDLTPPALRQKVADHLAALVEARGGHPATGFVGTALLLPVLSRYGHHDLAYRVLDTREFPSLGYMIDRGATTVWERWNSDKEGPDMNSRNHFCLGAMAQWLYENLVGLRPTDDAGGAGFRRVVIEPRPAGDVTFAQLRYAAPQGELAVRWELADRELVCDLTLPPNVTADVRLPSARPSETTVEGPDALSRDLDNDAPAAGLTLGPGVYRLVTPAPDRALMTRQVAALNG